MTTVAYTSTEIGGLVGAFTGGLAGAPSQLRASQKDKITAISFHFVQGGNTGNVGDTIDLAYVVPTTYVYGGILIYSANASSTLAIGVVDLNNSANNSSNKFLVATSLTSAGSVPIQAGLMPLQAGKDPAGDESTGNTPPGYGSALVTIQAVIAGAGLQAAGTFNGYLLVSAGN